MSINIGDIKNIVIEGVNTNDYPDFCDAFIASANCKGCGRELTEEELQKLTQENPEIVNQLAYESLIN